MSETDTKMDTLSYSSSLYGMLVCSAKRRNQSAELSHVNCFIQGEVIGFQVLLDSLHPCSTRESWWSPPVLQGELLRSSWHLFCIAFVQYGKQGDTLCLDNAWLSLSRHHHHV